MKTDKISRLHYIFNHASAERIRYLCKCNSFPTLENVTVKQCEHIRDCEFCRMALIHKKPCCKIVESHPVLGQVWNGDTVGPLSTPSLKSHFCKSVTDGVTHCQKMSYRGYFLFPIRFQWNFF